MSETKLEVATFTSSRGREYHIPAKYAKCSSVSDVIRSMTKDGWGKYKLAKFTGIRYQHVRNVLMG